MTARFMLTQGLVVAGSALVLALAACTPPAPAAMPPALAQTKAPAAPPPPRPAAKAVVFAGDDAITEARWLKTGEFLANSRRSLYRGAPERALDVSVLPFDANIVAVASADKADVAMVVTQDDKVTFLTPGKPNHVIAVPSVRATAALSADGLRAAVGAGASGDTILVLDVLSGKPLAEVPGDSARFDPTGQFVVTSRGVYTAEGKSVYERATPGREPMWIGGRAILMEEDEIVVVDAAKGSVVPTPTRCGEVPTTDEIDVTNKRAIRFCGKRLVVVGVEPLSRVELALKVPPQSQFASPLLWVGRDATIVLRWDEGAFFVADPGAKSVRETSSPPPMRYDAEHDVDVAFSKDGDTCRLGNLEPSSRACEARLSPNGARYLLLHRHQFEWGDAKTGEAFSRWGAPASETRLEVRAGAGFVEAVRINGSPKKGPPLAVAGLYQVGAGVAPKADDAVPAGCPAMAGRVHRKMGAKDAYFDGRVYCVCADGACSVPPLPPGFAFRGATAHGALALESWKKPKPKGQATSAGVQTKVALLLGEQDREVELDGRCSALTANEARALTLCTTRVGDANEVSWVELSLPDLAVTRRVPFRSERTQSLYSPAPSTILAVGETNVALEPHYRAGVVEGTVVSRVGVALARIFFFDTFAAVRFDTGKVELFGGEAPDGVLGCVVNGKLKPFADCRATVQLKGALRFDLGLPPKE
ncbi:MAG: hypothetical protein IPG50_34970 [Myxococcales bacterium]|nr:hypothetical protein [Myxococcales bacterium]